MEPLILLLIVTMGYGLWRLTRPAAAFVIRLECGVPRCVSGRVRAAFLEDVRDICARQGIEAGTIRGEPRSGVVRLRFSHGFTAPCQQQLRNVWTVSGC